MSCVSTLIWMVVHSIPIRGHADYSVLNIGGERCNYIRRFNVYLQLPLIFAKELTAFLFAKRDNW